MELSMFRLFIYIQLFDLQLLQIIINVNMYNV